jgi:hypothetical protein
MTEEIKILDPAVDIELFDKILIEFKDQILKLKNYAYDITNIDEYVEWYRYNFAKQSKNNFIVACILDEDQLVSLHMGCSISVIWGRPNEVLPVWVYLLAYNKPTNKIPGSTIGKLGVELMHHFENNQYYSFYTSTRLPVNLTTTADIQNYLENVYNKNYPIFRYNRYVEQIITTNDELKSILTRFGGYNLNLLPKKINRPFVLMKYEMMNNYRNLRN